MIAARQYIYHSRPDKDGLHRNSIMNAFTRDIGFGP